MLDDLRNDADFQEEELQLEEAPQSTKRILRRRSRGPFLGMTPSQRFVIALMLFLMVCVLGAAVLILTESMVLPFL